LELGLNRARPSHGDEFIAADFKIKHLHYGVLAPFTLQNIGGLGKSLGPGFAHVVRSNLGKLQAIAIALAMHPSND
jgi:hypothetical protein